MWDKTWEDVFRSMEWGKYPSEELIRFVARNFYREPDRQAIRILEIGCGTGANLWYIAREGFTVYGVDGSETAIRKAQSRLDEEVTGWRGELSVGDITNLPFEDGMFDAVIDVEAVSCNQFAAAQDIYREAHRVLKPGGKLFSRTFANGMWGDETGESIGYHAWLVAEGPLEGKGTQRFTTREDIDLLLPSSHFVIHDIELLERHVEQMTKRIREWCIIAVKQ